MQTHESTSKVTATEWIIIHVLSESWVMMRPPSKREISLEANLTSWLQPVMLVTRKKKISAFNIDGFPLKLF